MTAKVNLNEHHFYASYLQETLDIYLQIWYFELADSLAEREAITMADLDHLNEMKALVASILATPKAASSNPGYTVQQEDHLRELCQSGLSAPLPEISECLPLAQSIVRAVAYLDIQVVHVEILQYCEKLLQKSNPTLLVEGLEDWGITLCLCDGFSCPGYHVSTSEYAEQQLYLQSNLLRMAIDLYAALRERNPRYTPGLAIPHTKPS